METSSNRVLSRLSASLLALALGCSNNGVTTGAGDAGDGGGPSDAGDAGTAGGPVSGPNDTHCASATLQPTNQSDCSLTMLPDGGAGGTGAYGATLYNASGDDDGCKYQVSWSATPIVENQGVTFTLDATYLADGSPDPPACSGCAVQGLDTQSLLAEVFLSATHPAPNSNQTVTAEGSGVYSIGPILFDAPGRWTVRFHLFEQCSDVASDSPHGHAAFYVEVP